MIDPFLINDVFTYKPTSTTYAACYRMWWEFLAERIINLFKWTVNGDIEPHHIEERLLFSGTCGITYYENRLTAFYGNLFGPTVYFDEFKYMTVFSPIFSKTFRVGKTIAVIFNNSMHGSVEKLIHLYASALAHLWVTLINSAINLRNDGVGVVNTSFQVDAFNNYRNQLANGILQPMMDETFLDIKFPEHRNQKIELEPIYQTCMDMLNDFYEHFGVRTVYRKKGNLITDEVLGNIQKLRVNIDDMEECRKKGCEEVNRLFGKNWEVERSYADATIYADLGDLPASESD